ncbi:chloride channel protein [Patulibacter sp. NPDC049589]|uniref:chloride channel protein n=1 Tax=Patulibacter sp. NPDC049589 TaxID=3154731 RepID=UPI00341AC3C9
MRSHDALPPGHGPDPARAGDFSITPRTIGITALAAVAGVLVALVALALVHLIGLITHLVYTGHVATTIEQPDTAPLGMWSALVPVAGGLVVGAMARFGSERIRGHGIPEAMETVLLRGSRMEPRIAVLKPLSSAVSIGTGGPFGAEGPIIVTGGAIGSILGQFLHLTGAERRCLLAAGAAGGMTAIFGTPVAAVLLAVELLLFEWRPRSLIPVSAAALSALGLRGMMADRGLLPVAPLFPASLHVDSATSMIPAALLVGLCCGALAWLMTTAIYRAEDSFARLPIHWAWWPAIGGLVVGIGGLIDPRVLGVGYGVIDDELTGKLAVGALLSVLVVKLVVWAVALGSNTSGGVLAPLLMLGAALGGLLGSVVPGGDPATWAILGMTAAFGGVMRAPLTGIVFALETTGALPLLPALLATTITAYAVSVFALPRSILTEKIARRGHQVSCEYELDPMLALCVRDVMTTKPETVRPEVPVGRLMASLDADATVRRQRLFPIVSDDDVFVGVVSVSDLRRAAIEDPALRIGELRRTPLVAHPTDTLRRAADLMISTGHGVLPVVQADDPTRLAGLLTQFQLVAGHERQIVEERRRERPLLPPRRRRADAPPQTTAP